MEEKTWVRFGKKVGWTIWIEEQNGGIPKKFETFNCELQGQMVSGTLKSA